MTATYDITIIGSGIVGATAALALARNASLKIAIIEAKLPVFSKDPAQYDHRVSAISLASKRIFENLNSWEAIKTKRISPYTDMFVWDAQGKGDIHFNCQTIDESCLGYIIEDSVIRESLHAQFKSHQNIDFICPFNANTFIEKTNYIELETSDQKIIKTKLLIGADGAHSWVREQAQIACKERDYGHTAIVTTVSTELPHKNTAWQRFLPTGTLAFLPLDDPHRCSIVWSAEHLYAAKLLTLDEASFCKILQTEFDTKLGKIIAVTTRHSFPLRMRHVKNYVHPRLALIGDAAHTIHPLAGQGVNLGLLDAAALAEVITEALAKNRDFSNLATLRRYERWRKGDTLMMLTIVEGLKQLFGNNKKPFQSMRDLGLTLVDQLPFLKNLLVNYAVGKRDDLPKLAC